MNYLLWVRSWVVISETLVWVVPFRQDSLLQLLLCTNNKCLATNTLMSLLMKAGLIVFWQGTSKPFATCSDLLSGFYSAFVWLNLSWKLSVSCYKINCSFPVTCTIDNVTHQGFGEVFFYLRMLVLRGFISGIALSCSNSKLLSADLR